MRSFSEIDTTVKRATKSMGYSWGISEEVGKNIRLLEMFGIPGLRNLNQYYKILKDRKFQNLTFISKDNTSNIPYCPIIAGTSFMDQINILEELKEIEIKNLAFPILFLPFLSRASEIIGKRIFVSIDENEFLFNFNQSISAKNSFTDILDIGKIVKLKILENLNSFSEKEWDELYKLSENTFVEETDELKTSAAGAGLTDND
tara:strand:+ start:815 stop:1423 length:609 start_codon:yes stop_codon:yes gene_type:complete